MGHVYFRVLPLATVWIAASALYAGPAGQGMASNSWAPVVQLPSYAIVQGSSSVLHRRADWVTMHIASSGFAPDTVVTAWWVIFNYPSSCSHPVPQLNALCGGPDISNPATGTTYQWADGQVVREDGEVSLKASLTVGDTTHCASPTLPCVGLIDVRGAEYHIALRSMGPVIPILLREQLSTLNAGCLVGEPNAGLCGNVQGAIHLPK